MASRFVRYVRNVFRVALFLSALGLALLYMQVNYGSFDSQIAAVQDRVAAIDARLSNEAIAGISMGSIALVLALCLLPIFLRKIDERAYVRGLWRGVVSALVFYASSQLYEFAAAAGRLYTIAAIIAVIVVGTVLVEALSLAAREEEERSFRTDIVSSIASGLLFSIVMKILQYAAEFVKTRL